MTIIVAITLRVMTRRGIRVAESLRDSQNRNGIALAVSERLTYTRNRGWGG